MIRGVKIILQGIEGTSSESRDGGIKAVTVLAHHGMWTDHYEAIWRA